MLKQLFLLFVITLFFSCSNSNISGGGAEAGNGYIAGTVSIAGSQFNKGCEISLYPQNYSPFMNDSGKQTTLTDEKGNFSFLNIKEGEYQIHLQSADSLNSHLVKLNLLSDDDTLVQNYYLKPSSIIKLSVSDSFTESWYFVEGTDIKGPLSLDSNNTIILKGLPSDSLRISFYPDTLNSIINIPKVLHTNPGDTLHIVNRYSWIHLDSKNTPLPHDYIYSMYLDNDRQFWGTYYGYLEIEKSDTTLYDVFNSSLQSSWIKKLYKTSDGSIWILNKTGAVSYKADKTWGQNIYPDSLGSTYADIIDLCEISKDTILLGAVGGVIQLSPSDTIFDTTIVPTDASVFAIEQSKDGDIYFGTYNYGLFIKSVNNIDTINSSNSILSINNIQTLFIDSKDTLWIGTYGGGLYKYKNSLQKIDDLFTDSIYAITETSDGSIWASTSEGDLVRYLDGEIEVLNSSNTPLPKSAFLALSVDLYDRVYVGTYGYGLYILKEN